MPYFPCRRHSVVVSLLLISGAASATPTVAPGPGVDPADYQVTAFATGLNYPYGMAELADGSLLVATSTPSAGGGYFGSSAGSLVRLADLDGDGVAESSQSLISTLPGRVTALTRAGNLVLATTASPTAGADARINVLRAGATPADPLVPAGFIDIDYGAANPEHTSFALAVRPDPGVSGGQQVFFNLGSARNNVPTAEPVTLSGLTAGSVTADGLYAVTLTDSGAAVSAAAPVQIATGLRNAAGLAFHPTSGDLYLQDNGMDTPGNRPEPLSADELNRIPAAQLGGAVEDFGFERDYIEYRTGNRVGSEPDAVQPLVVFQPLTDPAGGADREAEGAAQIAFAPASFGPDLAGKVFVGFHGEFHSAGLGNRENPLVVADPVTGGYTEFISNDETGVGHLDGLLSTSDTLFVADFSPQGRIDSAAADGLGVIYRITVIPEPGVGLVLGLLATVVAGRRRRLPG